MEPTPRAEKQTGSCKMFCAACVVRRFLRGCGALQLFFANASSTITLGALSTREAKTQEEFPFPTTAM
jgi:hypothetical protein